MKEFKTWKEYIIFLMDEVKAGRRTLREALSSFDYAVWLAGYDDRLTRRLLTKFINQKLIPNEFVEYVNFFKKKLKEGKKFIGEI